MNNIDVSSFIENLPRGSHSSCVYASPQDLRPALTSFIKQGLEKNEQCLYIHSKDFQDDIKEALLNEEVNVEEMLSSQKLIFELPENVYLKNGNFDEEVVISLFKSSLESAKELGFDGIRVIGDASCLEGGESISDFMQYESKINNILEDLKITTLCIYNPEHFSDQTMVDVIRTHKFIIHKEQVIKSKYFEPSSDFVPISGTSLKNAKHIVEHTFPKH